MFRLKALLPCLVVLISVVCIDAQTQHWLWAKGAGGLSPDYIQAVVTDAEGFCYVTGYFEGSITFGDTTLTSTGDEDIFVAKLDINGTNWLWARQAGGASTDQALDIKVDSSSNVYITGCFSYESATFGSTILTGYNYSYVAKLDCDGNWLWAISIPGDPIVANSIALDSDSNVLIGGCFSRIAIFGNITLNNHSSEDQNVFVAKMDSNGTNWIWALSAAVHDYGRCSDIVVDSSENIYLTGSFSGSTTFGDTTLVTNELEEIFVSKLDSSGIWIWAKSAGGLYSDWGNSLALDSFNNIYLSGCFAGIATFDTITLNGTGDFNNFIAKLDSSGNTWLWAKNAGGIYYNLYSGNCTAVDIADYVYLTGGFFGTATFGSTVLSSNSGIDNYVAKLDPIGNWIWAMQTNGVDFNEDMDITSRRITTDNDSNIYVAEPFEGTATIGNTTLTGAGDIDFFVAKIGATVFAPDETIDITSQFGIINNYPNPFKSSTTISLNIENDKAVYELAVYDIKGRKISVLHDGFLTKGNHNLVFNGKDSQNNDLPSGVYVCQLSGAGKSQTQRMILIK